MENFTELHYVIGLVLLGYGITYGFRNTLYRALSWMCFGRLTQSHTGGLLDAVFYAGIGYLVLVHFSIIV